MTDKIIYLNEKPPQPAKPEYAAVPLWNKKALPICPGLGKKGRHKAKPLNFQTSDSYGCLTPENA